MSNQQTHRVAPRTIWTNEDSEYFIELLKADQAKLRQANLRRKARVPEEPPVQARQPFEPTPGYYRLLGWQALPTVTRHKILARVFFLLLVRELRAAGFVHEAQNMRYPLKLNIGIEDIDIGIEDIDEYLNEWDPHIHLVTHSEDSCIEETQSLSQPSQVIVKVPVRHAYNMLGVSREARLKQPLSLPMAVGNHVETARKQVSAWRRSRPDLFLDRASDMQIKSIARQFVIAFSHTGSDREDDLREVERRITIDTRGERSRLEARFLPRDPYGDDFMIPQGMKAFLVERDDQWNVWLPEQIATSHGDVLLD